MQCCLVLPSIACTNTSTDTVDIVSPYSGLVDTMNNDTRLQHLPRHASQPAQQQFTSYKRSNQSIFHVLLSFAGRLCLKYCRSTRRWQVSPTLLIEKRSGHR